jgi:hypothetical protein
MANPDTNKTSKDTLLVNQDARPTEISENQRINLVPNPQSASSKGESHATQDSENKRIKTRA